MNTLTITGAHDELMRFLEYAKEQRKDGEECRLLDANQFIPMPESLKVDAGSRDVVYDIWYGDIGKVKNYGWIPDDIKTDREKLKEFFRKEYKDADVMADKYKFNMDNYGCKTWYDWACQNWGSKWNFGSVHLVDEGGTDLKEPYDFKGTLVYSFDTAWSPMTPVIEAMGRMFPMLKFVLTYTEPGCGFAGTFSMEDGIITEDESHEYIWQDEQECMADGEESLKPRYGRLKECQTTTS
jgi:hypothetical protein